MPQTGSKKLLIISGITIGLILTSVVGIVLYKKK
ncbi:LPXTG cell wall anchor domain-containing protein [Ligilactobacillus salivarius]|nr:LPXTG cell wall anchor domain-containing protein [Ligilactobacillus salivarius]